MGQIADLVLARLQVGHLDSDRGIQRARRGADLQAVAGQPLQRPHDLPPGVEEDQKARAEQGQQAGADDGQSRPGRAGLDQRLGRYHDEVQGRDLELSEGKHAVAAAFIKHAAGEAGGLDVRHGGFRRIHLTLPVLARCLPPAILLVRISGRGDQFTFVGDE